MDNALRFRYLKLTMQTLLEIAARFADGSNPSTKYGAGFTSYTIDILRI
jgi:hypothetical protein